MRLILFIGVVAVWLLGASCEDRLFSLQAYANQAHGIRLIDVLRDISVRCEVSVEFADKRAKQKAYQTLDFVNVKDYTFEEFLDFLARKSNLFFHYDRSRRVIELAFLKTESFPIDYVNISTIESRNLKTIATGASSTSSTGTTTGTTTATTTGTGYGGYGGYGSTSSADMTTINTTLTFTFWDTLERNIHRIVPSTQNFRLVIDKDASLVVVTATRRDMERVREYLQALMDRMHQQVMIEAKFIELTYTDSQQVGIDWSRFALDLNAQVQGTKQRTAGAISGRLSVPDYTLAYNFSAQALFDFLKRYGTIKLLSNPKVMTLNNQPAVINVGKQLSYRYQSGAVTTAPNGAPVGTTTYNIGSTFVGITLFVIPEITNDGQIIMRINPVISDTDTNTYDQNGTTAIRELPPDIRIRQLTSIVKVKNGQKVLIGGLVSYTKSNDNVKVPILGDIPLLGRAFRSTKKSVERKELFILLTPRIVGKNYVPTIDEARLLGSQR